MREGSLVVGVGGSCAFRSEGVGDVLVLRFESGFDGRHGKEKNN